MSQQRVQRAREQIKVEISDIIRNSMRDPRIGELTTVTDVEVSSDLRQAKVFVSVYGDAALQAQTMKSLEGASGFIRTELSRRLSLRFTPEIGFALDTSIAYGARIFELLNQVKTVPEAPAAPETPGKDHE